MGDFRRLVAWQKAHAFGLALHAAFRGRNAHISTGFRGQILRAANSISDCLAEGCAKRSRRDLARYADDAYGSGKEVQNDLIKARDLGMLERTVAEDLLTQCDEVCRLCFGLARGRPPRDEDPWPTEPEI